jgi:hypothetical protein
MFSLSLPKNYLASRTPVVYVGARIKDRPLGRTETMRAAFTLSILVISLLIFVSWL